MANRRFQFRLSTLLWITLAVACWFGGMETRRRIDAVDVVSPTPITIFLPMAPDIPEDSARAAAPVPAPSTMPAK